MPSDEYVYIIAKDMKTGRVITLQDNRDRLDIEMEEALTPVPLETTGVATHSFP